MAKYYYINIIINIKNMDVIMKKIRPSSKFIWKFNKTDSTIISKSRYVSFDIIDYIKILLNYLKQKKPPQSEHQWN